MELGKTIVISILLIYIVIAVVIWLLMYILKDILKDPSVYKKPFIFIPAIVTSCLLLLVCCFASDPNERKIYSLALALFSTFDTTIGLIKPLNHLFESKVISRYILVDTILSLFLANFCVRNLGFENADIISTVCVAIIIFSGILRQIQKS